MAAIPAEVTSYGLVLRYMEVYSKLNFKYGTRPMILMEDFILRGHWVSNVHWHMVDFVLP